MDRSYELNIIILFIIKKQINIMNYFIDTLIKGKSFEEVIEIVKSERGKEGFGVPLSEWFYDSKGMGRFIDILSDKKTRDRGVINVGYMDKLLTNYVRKELSSELFETILWPIINLEIWFRIFVDDDMSGYA